MVYTNAGTLTMAPADACPVAVSSMFFADHKRRNEAANLRYVGDTATSQPLGPRLTQDKDVVQRPTSARLRAVGFYYM